MHELSIVESMVSTAGSFAKEHKIDKVSYITVQVGKSFFSALRQESIAVSSASDMPEKSGAERIAEKFSFIKSSFVENSTDLLI